MKARPLRVTIISWMFIAVGSVALAYHLLPQHIGEVKDELLWICFIRGVALASGVFMLYGFNWARWLLVGWMTYHMVLSFLHSPFEVAVHGVLFGIISCFLFSPKASGYFRRRSTNLPQASEASRPSSIKP